MNWYPLKLDGVGPVDNRPSTDKLQHFVNFFLAALRSSIPQVVGHVCEKVVNMFVK